MNCPRIKFSNRLIITLVVLTILLLIAIFVFNSKIVVKAQNQIKIFPIAYSIESSNGITWQNPQNAFTQDLSDNASFADFNQDNSAFISLNTEEETTTTEPVTTTTIEPTTTTTIPLESTTTIPQEPTTTTESTTTTTLESTTTTTTLPPEETTTTTNPPETPIITEYPQRLYPGNPLIVKGTSNVCDHIILFAQDERKDILTTDAKCEDGAFTVILGRTLDKGIYNIWAKAVDARGAQSNSTEPVKIIVSLPIFIKIGSIVIDYLNVIITLFALIILMAMAWIYGWKKVRDLKKAIKKETKEAEAALYKGFNILREEIAKQVAKLDGKPGLSKKEKALNEELKTALNNAEKVISKEIKDIRKELKSKDV